MDLKLRNSGGEWLTERNGAGRAGTQAGATTGAAADVDDRTIAAAVGNQTDGPYATTFDTLVTQNVVRAETITGNECLERPSAPWGAVITPRQSAARAGVDTLAAEVAGTFTEVDEWKSVGILLQQPARTLVATPAAAAAQRQKCRLGHRPRWPWMERACWHGAL